MYKVNDTIRYSSAICKITAIIEKEIFGERAQYYVLSPLYDDKTVVYIPVKSEAATAKIHHIMSADEIYSIVKDIQNENTFCIEEDEMNRRKRCRDILFRGENTELILLIKALNLRQQSQKGEGKKKHTTDEQFMKDAEKMLYAEFAYVLHIKPEQVLPFILEQIEIDGKSEP